MSFVLKSNPGEMDVAIRNRNVVKGALCRCEEAVAWSLKGCWGEVGEAGGMSLCLSILPLCPLNATGPACASPGHGGCCERQSLPGSNSGVFKKAGF